MSDLQLESLTNKSFKGHVDVSLLVDMLEKKASKGTTSPTQVHHGPSPVRHWDTNETKLNTEVIKLK